MIGSSLALIRSHPAAVSDRNSNMHLEYSGMTRRQSGSSDGVHTIHSSASIEDDCVHTTYQPASTAYTYRSSGLSCCLSMAIPL